MPSAHHPPRFYIIALLVLNAAIWLSFGTISLIRMKANTSLPDFVLLIIAVLMLGNAGAFLLSAWALRTRLRGAFWLTLTVLLVNIVLTFTDQFGWFDFATLLLDLIIFGLLLRDRLVEKAYN